MSYIKENLIEHEEACKDPDCAQCCDHSDHDGHCCLICGTDMILYWIK